MAFVNEYPSEEDIKKYDLDEVWLRYHPIEKRKGEMPPGFYHDWTVDRERDAYFMIVAGGRESMETGRLCVLYLNKKYYSFYLAIAPGGSRKFSEQPFKRIWELRKVEQLDPGSEYDEMVKILKEALTVYGVGGARRQVPDTIVEFGNGFHPYTDTLKAQRN